MTINITPFVFASRIYTKRSSDAGSFAVGAMSLCKFEDGGMRPEIYST